MSNQATFPPDVVDAVCRHMNDDHTEDSLLIVRSLGGQPDATAATMIGLDDESAHFSASFEGTVEGTAESAGKSDLVVRVPWSGPVTERAHIRAEVVRMYHDACEALGIEPRRADEH